MPIFSFFRGLFGGSPALSNRRGDQYAVPSTALVPDTAQVGPDGALQISAVWSCVDRRATTLASLPLFTYAERGNGMRDLARTERVYSLLHDRPNPRMTAFDFWRALVMNLDLRGNGYARIDRDARGEAVALWPMPADQVLPFLMDDGTLVYQYRVDENLAVLSADSVLHIKGLGNGTVGLSKLEYMRATTDEAAKAQTNAARLFGNGGKPTGVLMLDNVLNTEQRKAIRERFAEMASGTIARLYVLEANMKYQQLSMSPEDQQLLQTRQFSVEEICRWFDVPPVLVHHSNVTTWGSGVEQIVAGFHKFTIRPLLVSIEQAIRMQVLTPAQRSRLTVEFNFDALLRGDPKARADYYASGAQNGWLKRNEIRQLENLAPVAGAGADMLTAQSNLVPIDMMGQAPARGGSDVPAQAPVAQ